MGDADIHPGQANKTLTSLMLSKADADWLVLDIQKLRHVLRAWPTHAGRLLHWPTFCTCWGFQPSYICYRDEAH
jgi:hypothetical protein